MRRTEAVIAGVTVGIVLGLRKVKRAQLAKVNGRAQSTLDQASTVEVIDGVTLPTNWRERPELEGYDGFTMSIFSVPYRAQFRSAGDAEIQARLQAWDGEPDYFKYVIEPAIKKAVKRRTAHIDWFCQQMAERQLPLWGMSAERDALFREALKRRIPEYEVQMLQILDEKDERYYDERTRNDERMARRGFGGSIGWKKGGKPTPFDGYRANRDDGSDGDNHNPFSTV